LGFCSPIPNGLRLAQFARSIRFSVRLTVGSFLAASVLTEEAASNGRRFDII
jgi:hypothetical protein